MPWLIPIIAADGPRGRQTATLTADQLRNSSFHTVWTLNGQPAAINERLQLGVNLTLEGLTLSHTALAMLGLSEWHSLRSNWDGVAHTAQ